MVENPKSVKGYEHVQGVSFTDRRGNNIPGIRCIECGEIIRRNMSGLHRLKHLPRNTLPKRAKNSQPKRPVLHKHIKFQQSVKRVRFDPTFWTIHRSRGRTLAWLHQPHGYYGEHRPMNSDHQEQHQIVDDNQNQMLNRNPRQIIIGNDENHPLMHHNEEQYIIDVENALGHAQNPQNLRHELQNPPNLPPQKPEFDWHLNNRPNQIVDHEQHKDPIFQRRFLHFGDVPRIVQQFGDVQRELVGNNDVDVEDNVNINPGGDDRRVEISGDHGILNDVRSIERANRGEDDERANHGEYNRRADQGLDPLDVQRDGGDVMVRSGDDNSNIQRDINNNTHRDINNNILHDESLEIGGHNGDHSNVQHGQGRFNAHSNDNHGEIRQNGQNVNIVHQNGDQINVVHHNVSQADIIQNNPNFGENDPNEAFNAQIQNSEANAVVHDDNAPFQMIDISEFLTPVNVNRNIDLRNRTPNPNHEQRQDEQVHELQEWFTPVRNQNRRILRPVGNNIVDRLEASPFVMFDRPTTPRTNPTTNGRNPTINSRNPTINGSGSPVGSGNHNQHETPRRQITSIGPEGDSGLHIPQRNFHFWNINDENLEPIVV
ncbi:unnamed protein product [Bursaphelenchus okinawaensis]|uniref:Uncharacterized protein n=1 Tax=Bursaphelenchus okinawaensis TaxID=465554 RepID=A0A811LLY0_9BILA|nr:unnamed protein product [Bursaphelenchus okinawaensis]CAG9123851.1 unnamed protein product [Bursaphelenchus okinawaensis]